MVCLHTAMSVLSHVPCSVPVGPGLYIVLLQGAHVFRSTRIAVWQKYLHVFTHFCGAPARRCDGSWDGDVGEGVTLW